MGINISHGRGYALNLIHYSRPKILLAFKKTNLAYNLLYLPVWHTTHLTNPTIVLSAAITFIQISSLALLNSPAHLLLVFWQRPVHSVNSNLNLLNLRRLFQ
jgi:hypothetical protein